MKDNLIKPAPWDQKPGIQAKLEIDEAENLFDDWDESEIVFDKDCRENDMVFDYEAARKNAHFCVHASKKILDLIAKNLQYDHNPLVADACVKLIKVMSENNRDIMKLHKDFKTTKLIGKPKTGESSPDIVTPETEADRQDKVAATVSEVVAAAKAAKENDANGKN